MGARAEETVRVSRPSGQRRREAAPPALRRGAMDGGVAAERDLVRVMLTSRAMLERIMERIGPGEFRDERYREIFEKLAHHGPDADIATVAGDLSERAVSEFESLLSEPGAIIDVQKTVDDCLIKLENRNLQERSEQIQRQLAVATPAEADKLVAEKQATKNEMRRLSNRQMPT